jgi:F0F1-type ATP synthase membrane subunit b/b'
MQSPDPLEMSLSFLATLDPVLSFLHISRLDFVMIVAGSLLFVGFISSLNRLVLRHFIALVSEREAATAGAEISAADLLSRAKELEDQYSAKLTLARVDALQLKTKRLQDAKQESVRIAEKAAAEAEEILRLTRWELAQKIEQVRQQLSAEAEGMAQSLSEKILQSGTEANSIQNI